MNNRQRTAEVIRTWQARHKTEMDSDTDWAAQNLAGDLADAGRLAPDLPEPNEAGFWHTDNTVTRALPNLLVEAGFYDQGVDTYVKLTPDEAREVAHILLAAANCTEEGNRE